VFVVIDGVKFLLHIDSRDRGSVAVSGCTVRIQNVRNGGLGSSPVR
jgi:hypothetical protein